MRPVNLIPSEERKGDRGQTRTGSISYLVVGALAVLFFAVVALAFTGKKISDKEAEKAAAEQELTQATARAESLREFEDFRQVHDTRTQTVSSLAQSRFDWERVMRELALIIPTNVWLINLTGTVSPAVQLNGGAEVSTRDTVAGPALEIVGCTVDQDASAGFIASLEDIDGVTRVGVESSGSGTDESGGGAAAGDSAEGGVDSCPEGVVTFKIVVAFDAVPPPPAANAAPGVPATGAPAAPEALAAQSAQPLEGS